MINSSSNIFLIGMMGSGKSYWGKVISEMIHYKFVDMDELLILQEGKSINDIFKEKGEQYFREKETEILQQSFLYKDNFVMATGGGLPCFNNNMKQLNEQGITIWINEPVVVLYERLLKEKSHRPLLKDLSEDGIKEFIQIKLTERTPYYNQAKYIVSGKDITPEFIHQIIINH